MNMTLAFLNGPEVIALLVLVLILFGAKKLPELARGLGQGLKEFKKSSKEIQEDLNTAMNEEPSPVPAKRVASTTIPSQTVEEIPTRDISKA